MNIVLHRTVVLFIAASFAMASQAQSSITTKVYRESGATTAFYGKLHIPQGGKYRISLTPADGTVVGVFRAYADGQDIYLSSVDPYGRTYWIDATETEHNFVVRTNDGSDVVAVPVTAEEDADMKAKNYFYFGKSNARKNALQWTSENVEHATLNESATFSERPVYVMANPARRGLAFAWLNATGTSYNLPAGSLYLLGKKGSRARYMNIVFLDDFDEDATSINAVNTLRTPASVSDDACYTLQGVRVAEPQKGTLYIRNGKKYVAE